MDSNSSTPKVNFSQDIKFIQQSFTKIIVTLLAYPLISAKETVDTLVNTGNLFLIANDMKPTPKIVNDLYQVTGYFNYKAIRDHINSVCNDLPSYLLAQNDHSFFDPYPDLLSIEKHYYKKASDIQILRSRLNSVCTIFNSNLFEMEKFYQRINSISESQSDSIGQIRTSVTGSTLGFMLGSFILPGIGSVVGTGLGGYFMNKKRTDDSCLKVYELLSAYINESNTFFNSLMLHLKELYSICMEVFQKFTQENDVKMYYEMKKVRPDDIDIIFDQFLKNSIEDIKSYLIEPDEDGITMQEKFSVVESYIHQYHS